MAQLNEERSRSNDVRSHFYDSGAFGFNGDAVKWARKQGLSDRGKFGFYRKPIIRDFLKGYITFVKRYEAAIDYYANVDVIGDHERTLVHQRYLEEVGGLNPVPVVHYGAPMSALTYYLDNGYDYIGLGGLVGTMMKAPQASREWLDDVFDTICDTPDRLPRVRVHGFGVTSMKMLWRYPWWSVDSSTWAKMTGYGWVLVPITKGGEWYFRTKPNMVRVTDEGKDAEDHYDKINPREREIVDRWLDEVKVPIGKSEFKDNGEVEVIEPGARNSRPIRVRANIAFFEHVSKAMPDWPWPFPKQQRGGRLFIV